MIDGKTINCYLTIQAAGVVVTRSVINGGVGVNSGSFRIEDSEIRAARCTDCTVNGSNFTILRTEITGGNRGAYCASTCLIQDSWIHAQNLLTGAHAGGVRQEQYLTLRHSTVACDWYPPSDATDTGCSADLTGYPDFVPIHHNTVDGNLFIANPNGLAFCVYGGGTGGKPYSNNAQNATYQVFTNNVFQRGTGDFNGVNQCGDYGPVTDFIVGRTGNVWQNNRFDDGTVVNPA